MITLRIRSMMWCLAGIAIAIALVWSLAAWRADAAPGPNEATFVPVTPTRVLDTRDPTNVGLSGPFVSAVSQDLQVTGTIATTTGNQLVVPAGSNGVVLNVTVINATANGFLSLRPGNAVGPPTTSSLNFLAGQIVANAVEVPVPASGADAGRIEITFDAYGTPGPTVDVIIDIVGYFTTVGLQQLVADVAAKANAADVLPHGDITFNHGTSQLTPNGGNPPAAFTAFASGNTATGPGTINFSPTGPAQYGSVTYGLKSLTYCIEGVSGTFITAVAVHTETPFTTINDGTDRATNGCFTVAVNRTGPHAFDVAFSLGGGGSGRFVGIRTTWAPSSTLTPVASFDEEPALGDPSTGR